MGYTHVILKNKVSKLGAEADIVRVRRGYARNFLIPQGLALEATEKNKVQTEELKAIRAEREAKELESAQVTAAKVRKLKLKLELTTGQRGKAFGSVTALDIRKALASNDVEVDRHDILLEAPIKQTGKFDVPVRLHPQLTVDVKLNVVTAGSLEEESAE